MYFSGEASRMIWAARGSQFGECNGRSEVMDVQPEIVRERQAFYGGVFIVGPQNREINSRKVCSPWPLTTKSTYSALSAASGYNEAK